MDDNPYRGERVEAFVQKGHEYARSRIRELLDARKREEQALSKKTLEFEQRQEISKDTSTQRRNNTPKVKPVKPIRPLTITQFTRPPITSSITPRAVNAAENITKIGRIPKRSRPMVESPFAMDLVSQRSPPLEIIDIRYADSRLKWYYEIKTKTSNTRVKGQQSIIVRLKQIRGLIDKSVKVKIPDKALLDQMRRELHELEFVEVTAIALREAAVLDHTKGLPRLFDSNFSNGIEYPWDIRADANELFNKWANQVFSPDLLRGIITSTTDQKLGERGRRKQRINPAYQLKVNCQRFGQVDLINGQWWPLQLCALRDGAHGSSQGGIHGSKGKGGAYSIVLAGSHYDDIDEGDDIWYCGTDGKNFTHSENTQILIESVEKKNPIRVLRSMNLQKSKSSYAPSHGYRYDGLYRAMDYKELKGEPDKKRLRFHLKRLPDQDPIRHSGIGLGARPTDQEIEEYKKIKELFSCNTET